MSAHTGCILLSVQRIDLHTVAQKYPRLLHVCCHYAKRFAESSLPIGLHCDLCEDLDSLANVVYEASISEPELLGQSNRGRERRQSNHSIGGPDMWSRILSFNAEAPVPATY